MAQQKNAGVSYGWTYSQPRDQINDPPPAYAYPMTNLGGGNTQTNTAQVPHAGQQSGPSAPQGNDESRETPTHRDNDIKGLGMLPGGRLLRSAIFGGLLVMLVIFSLVLYQENQGLETNIKKKALNANIGYIKTVKLRIENNKKSKELEILKVVTFKDNNGNSALHGAVDRRNETLVKFLVDNNAMINGRNNKLETPLHRATLGIDKTPMSPATLRIIKYLISQGANVYAKDVKEQTFLHNLFIDNTTITPSQFNELAEFLIEKRYAKLFNTPEGAFDITPFQLAVKELEIRETTLRLLQGNGVDFNAADSEGDSVIFYAVYGKRSTALLARLILLGADWRHLNNNEESLLHWAAARCYVNGMNYVIYLGLDVNGKDLEGDTPLHCVLYSEEANAWEAIRLLVAKGADRRAKNNAGLTPLAMAMGNDDLTDQDRIVELLKFRREG